MLYGDSYNMMSTNRITGWFYAAGSTRLRFVAEHNTNPDISVWLLMQICDAIIVFASFAADLVFLGDAHIVLLYTAVFLRTA